MNQALWLLLGLQLRGWLRYLLRNLSTVKGALLALVGLCVFIPWCLSVLLLPHTGGQSLEEVQEKAQTYGPALLLLYCLLNVLTSTADKAIYFTPAEVNFLFSGPFSRRQVLGYKILFTFLISLPATLLLTVFFRTFAFWLPAAYVGVLLIFLFMQLFSIAINLLAISIGARLYSRGRKLFLAAVVVLAAVLAYQRGAGLPHRNWQLLLEGMLHSPVWQAVSTPLRWLIEAFLARNLWPELVLNALKGGLVDLTLLGVVFALDAQYQEAAAAASARIYSRLQRLRGRNVEGEERSNSRGVRFSLPLLPWGGGIGPNLWRQMTTAMRGLGRLLLVLTLIGVLMLGPLLANTQADEEDALARTAASMVLSMSIFITPLVPFDFRGDLDRLAVLKTFPLSSWRLALSQVLTPMLLMSGLQWLALMVMLIADPRGTEFVLIVAAYVPPFNFLLFTLENLLFLLFPTRLAGNTPGDFQALGRNVLFLLAKMLVLLMVGGVASLVGLIVWWLTGRNLLAALAAAWPVVLISGLALIPFVALAFEAFDVGRDTPA